jgi:hypothetical protein
MPLWGLQFGTNDLAFDKNMAGSAGETAFPREESPAVIGSLLDVDVASGARRFLIHSSEVERNRPSAPASAELASLTKYARDRNLTPPGLGAWTSSVSEPTTTASAAGTTDASPAQFVASWSGGQQIADGLAGPAEERRGNVEVVVNSPGNPAQVLLTMDTALPDARAELVRLQDSDLAIVPTYLVGDAPVAAVALPAAEERPNLALTTIVVGLDELPNGGSRAPVSVDRLFELLASAEGGGDGEAWMMLRGAGVRPARIEDRELPTPPTDAGFALREWLDGLVNRGGGDTKVVVALALEGLVAYVYWQRLASCRSKSHDQNHGRQWTAAHHSAAAAKKWPRLFQSDAFSVFPNRM